MAYTAYLSDPHPDHQGYNELIKSYRIVNNHLASMTDNAATVFAGDFAPQDLAPAVAKGQASEEEADQVRKNAYQGLENELSKIQGGKFAISGNHDKNASKYMKSLTFIDEKGEPVDINGRKHFGIFHTTSTDFRNKYKGDYSAIENEKNLKGKVELSDVLLTHEGLTDELAASKGSYSKKLHDLALNTSEKRTLVNVCGHAHGSKYIEKDGLVGIRPYSGQGNGDHGEGAMFFVLHNGNKDIVYKVKNSKVIEYAKELAGEEFEEDSQEQSEKSPQEILQNAIKAQDQEGNEFIGLEDNPTSRNIAQEIGIQPGSFTQNNTPYLAFPKNEFNQAMQQMQPQQQQNQQNQQEEEEQREAA